MTVLELGGRSLAISLLLIVSKAGASSVSISDNLLVLSNSDRSGQIELLSMTSDAKEFTLALDELPDGVQDGREFLRWGPKRIRVPANRGRPMRAVFRPPADLDPGEYVVRLRVKSVDAGGDGMSRNGTGEGELGEGVGASVGIQPVLPITIYMRHKVESPELEITEFIASPDDDNRYGYFTAAKAPDAISYIGTVLLEGADSGQTYTSGRLRLGQTSNETRINVPKRGDDSPLEEAVCLKVWNEFPAKGRADQTVCSD